MAHSTPMAANFFAPHCVRDGETRSDTMHPSNMRDGKTRSDLDGACLPHIATAIPEAMVVCCGISACLLLMGYESSSIIVVGAAWMRGILAEEE